MYNIYDIYTHGQPFVSNQYLASVSQKSFMAWPATIKSSLRKPLFVLLNSLTSNHWRWRTFAKRDRYLSDQRLGDSHTPTFGRRLIQLAKNVPRPCSDVTNLRLSGCLALTFFISPQGDELPPPPWGHVVMLLSGAKSTPFQPPLEMPRILEF